MSMLAFDLNIPHGSLYLDVTRVQCVSILSSMLLFSLFMISLKADSIEKNSNGNMTHAEFLTKR